MNKRSEELKREFGQNCSDMPETLDIQSDKIRQMVNRSIDSTPGERVIYMKQKRLKAVAIFAAAVIFATTTVWASSNLDVLKQYFTGDTSTMEEHVKTPLESVTDGRFALTLEQVLTTRNRAMLIYSIEGLTDEAVSELMSASFMGMDTISVRPLEDSGVSYSSMSQGEMKEMRTASKQYWSCDIAGLDNPEGVPFFLSLNVMEGERKYITIPMETNVETLDLALVNHPYEDTVVKLSPIDILLEKDIPDDFEYPLWFTDTFFRMKDGSIKTFNQLFKLDGYSYAGNDIDGDTALRYQYDALPHEVLDLSQIKSIIVGNLEYDLADTSKMTEVKMDEVLYPFIQKPVYDEFLWLPVQEAAERLGGEVKVDESGSRVTVIFRETTLEIVEGQDYYLQDGKKTAALDAPIVKDGVLAMAADDFTGCFKVDLEADTAEELADWYWHIIP